MNVNDNSQFRSTHAGTNYVFCSASCKATFDKEPERYVKAGGPGARQGGQHHGNCC